MKKILILLLLCIGANIADAQHITRNYQNQSLSHVLEDLNATTTRHEISFIYNDLEQFTVTCQLEKASLDDALRTVVGFYPVRIVRDGEKYFVECTHKTERHVKGRLIDEHSQPVAFANVALLSPADSSLIGGGVSNEAGDFVIPTEVARVIVRCSYVGYKTLYRNCEVGNIGTLRMQPAEYSINGVTVKGTSIINYVDKSVHTFSAEQIGQARNVRDLLEHVEDLRIDLVSNKLQRMDGGSVKILLNGVGASDIDLKGIPANKIVRVEYYNIPPARYADAGTLINVITKRMDTGVNAGIEASTAFTTGFSNDEAYLNLTSGNHQLSLSYSFNLRNYTKRYAEKEYAYIFTTTGGNDSDQDTYNYKEHIHDKFGYTWNDPVIKYTYNKPDDIAIQIVATPHFDYRHSDGEEDVEYVQQSSEAISGKGERGSRINSFGPDLNVYAQKTLSNGQELSVDLVGTYYHNSSRGWQEDFSNADSHPLLTDHVNQKNDKYSFIGEMAYTKKWTKSSLSLGYRGEFGRSKATISNVLSDYQDYDYTSARYKHYMYAEYSGSVSKLMYRIGAGATHVTQDNTDAHDAHWLFTPKLILSTNLSKTMNLQWVTSSWSNTPAISQLSNNASLVIPGVMSIGNPYLKSYNSYQTELIYKWNLSWLQTQLSLLYTYNDSPVSRYYKEQTINGQRYIVGMNENANYSSDLGGSYQFAITPWESRVLTIFLQGYVYRQTVSSPIIGRYHHTWAPLYYGLQFRKGQWGAAYTGNIVSKRLNGSMLDAGENMAHLQVFWQKNGWRIYAADYWLFTRARYSGYTLPTSILESRYKTWIDDNRSMFVLGFSYDFSTGKNLKINRKLQNKDSDTGAF